MASPRSSIRVSIGDYANRKIGMTIKTLEKFRDANFAWECTRQATREGVKMASSLVPVDSGDLKKSIKADIPQKSTQGKVAARVYSDSEYAAYVEFGTGGVGSGDIYGGDPHPWAENYDWEYDSNGRGYHGWFYPVGNSRKAHAQWTPKTGKYAGVPMAHTYGLAPARFMYETYKYMKARMKELALEQIEKEINELYSAIGK